MDNNGQPNKHTSAFLFQRVQLFDSPHKEEVEEMSAIQRENVKQMTMLIHHHILKRNWEGNILMVRESMVIPRL